MKREPKFSPYLVKHLAELALAVRFPQGSEHLSRHLKTWQRKKIFRKANLLSKLKITEKLKEWKCRLNSKDSVCHL